MNKFVFVVCGAKEHIEELNFSLKFLRKFSKNEIIVLSDLKRNEIKIEHNNIIQIDTPKEFDNHESSIFIKTGINKFLPKGHNYCYLDGDIVAINEKVDNIFNFFNPPISFAKDHCVFEEFSPHALNCNCLSEIINRQIFLIKKQTELFETIDLSNPKILKQHKHLVNIFENRRKKPLQYLFSNLIYLLKRYVLPIKHFKIEDFTFLKTNKYWYNTDNEIILTDFVCSEKNIWKKHGVKYLADEGLWIDKSGKRHYFKTPVCSHLSEYLFSEYQIKIPDNWRQWNGGVFLFNEKSEEFLNYWHEITIKEFSNPYTKTRDQATLAVSVWKFGLENHINIPEEYNWICEYANNNIAWDKTRAYTKDGFKTKFYPSLLHVYHEWGNKDWSIWQSLSTKDE